MQNTYSVIWSDYALDEMQQTIAYLELNFTEREIRNLWQELEETLHHISVNPNLFPISEKDKGTHRAVVARYNTMYYSVSGNVVEIISFFSNRQSPEKRKL